MIKNLKRNSTFLMLFILLFSSSAIMAQNNESGGGDFNWDGMNDLDNVNVPGYSGGSDSSDYAWDYNWDNNGNSSTTHQDNPNNEKYNIATKNNSGTETGGGTGGVTRQNSSEIILTKTVKPGEKHTQAVKALRGPHNSTDRFVSNLMVNGLQVGIVTFFAPKKDANGVHIYTQLTIEVFSNSPISFSSLSPATTENSKYDGSEHSKNDNLQHVLGNISIYKDLGVVEFNLPMNENEDLIIKGTPYDPYNPPKIKDPCEVAKELTALAKDLTYKKAVTDIKTAAVDGLEHGISLGKNSSGQTIATAMAQGIKSSVNLNYSIQGFFADLHNHPSYNSHSASDLYNITVLNNLYSKYSGSIVLAGEEIYVAVVTDLPAAQIFATKYINMPTAGIPASYPESINKEILKTFSNMDSYLIEAYTKAKSIVMDKYNAGITFFKQGTNSVFYPIKMKEVKQANGSKKYTLVPCS